MRRFGAALLLTACQPPQTSTAHPGHAIEAISVNAYGCRLLDAQLYRAGHLIGVELKARCRVVGREELPTHIRLENWRPEHASLTVVLPMSIHRGPGPLDGAAGACYRDTIAISIGDAKRDTLAHELGHFAGLGHEPAPGNVMGTDRDNDATFTREQLEAIWRKL